MRREKLSAPSMSWGKIPARTVGERRENSQTPCMRLNSCVARVDARRMDAALVAVVLVVAFCASLAVLRIVAARLDHAGRVAELRIEMSRLQSQRRDRR